ncbi:MAG: hypothetical protein E6496_02725 [Lachnoanaerobaculum sp.]|uniref:hypothetical protein n=1 Tax=Lachnoanaerobaculum sp. OBRC5-5 TaxID=936595 RepID=UPI0012E9A708|nr:hypothetical protein [Lachnoanaerobaculum sp. OBRC5-5]MDU6629297.1 hypothetical protein [Lachnoanaerobaculum sp.]
MSTYNNSQVLTALNAIMDLGLDKKYYQPKDLNKKKFNLDVPYNIFCKEEKSG